jgi:cell division protein FtsN
MANYERDKDDGRVYTGDEEGDEGEGSHLPVVIIITILVLAAFGGVVWLAYNQGVARGRNEPVRVASAEQAGNGSQIKVYQQPAGSEEEDDNSQAAAKPADPPPAARTEAPPVQNTPPAAAPALAAAPPPAPIKMAQAPKQQVQPPAPVAAKPSSPPAAAPVRTVQAAPPVAATRPPAQLGLARPAAEAPLTTKPVPRAVAAAPAKPIAAAKPAVTKAVAGGSYLLQIGAYKSEAEAMAAWKTYEGKHAALLSGFSPDVQKADLADKGVWYRLRIASFSDKDGAMALCDRLKAQNGACFLAH